MAATVEVFPEHSKYYWNGHRACGIARGPGGEAGDLCPVCGKPLTVGVAHRVAARRPQRARGHLARLGQDLGPLLVSLPEILSQIHGVAATAKAVIAAHAEILARLGPELRVLIGLRSPTSRW